LALDTRIQRRIDGEHEIALESVEFVDVAVVHEEPAAMTEGVAIRLLHSAADRRSDMGEEVRRADVVGELVQVLVVPGRLGAVEDAGSGRSAVPADAEAVTICRLGAEP
jgi:hypothetical protein